MSRKIVQFNHDVRDSVMQGIDILAGAVKTKDEAQTIVDAEQKKLQDAWDANNEDGESADEKIARLGAKPADITLEE